MSYWLFKSEANCYSIDDLQSDKKTSWTGIRNYQVRNFLRDSIKVNDSILFYHSSGKIELTPTGVYGVAKVISNSYPDKTQFNPKDEHFDQKATCKIPIWECVDIGFIKKFKKPVSLSLLRLDPKCSGMPVLERGNRLSIQPVSKKHFDYIVKILAK